MSKKTRRTRRMRNMLLVVSMMLVVAMASVGVTVAWLTDDTQTIVNTFTTSDIAIELIETDADGDGDVNTNSYKMVPGHQIEKDPEVKVVAGSEACYLFVKMEESKNFAEFLNYEMADGWTLLQETIEGKVYYREVNADTAAAGQTYGVIKDDQVNVNTNVTKEQLNAYKGENAAYPQLKVTAYACQMDSNIDSASEAWTVIGTGDLPNLDQGASED